MPRQQTHEIAIDAPIEAVWKAIADGEELTRWFVEEASVEPRVGGTITISWDGEEKSSGTIEAWEPNKKLRKKLAPMDMGAAKHDPAVPMIDEYTIERRDGKTVLRLVCSGIPDATEWDGFYNGTDSGWASFFRTLRHYLEHNPGKPRTTIKVMGTLTGSLEETWPRLLRRGRAARHRRLRAGARHSRSGDPLARRRLPLAHDVGPIRLHDAVALREERRRRSRRSARNGSRG